jgi:hypothetical protein
MAIRARWVSQFIVDVRGMSLATAPRVYWLEAVNRMGDALQEMISDSFAGERTMGAAQLRTNTPKWNAYKARKGLDPRRGHATGNLQSHLEAGRRLFQVRRASQVKKGEVAYRIYFRPAWLHSRVRYAAFYEAAKVRTRGILSVARAWVARALFVVRAAEAEAIIRAKRAAGRASGRIRPQLGLTVPFLRRFGGGLAGGLAIGGAIGFGLGSAVAAEQRRRNEREEKLARLLESLRSGRGTG